MYSAPFGYSNSWDNPTPQYVGAMHDLFRGTYGDAEGLRLALMTLPAISLVAGGIAWFGRHAVVRDVERLGGNAAA